MYFYKKLYVDDTIKKKTKSICWKLKHNSGQLDIYVISLACGNDLFDIFHCANLKQKSFPRENLYVVGIAKGYDNAVLLAKDMVMDLYQKYNTIHFKESFMKAEADCFRR